MKIKTVEEIMLEIKQRYDQEPKAWRILRGRDQNGHYDTYVAQSDQDLWHVKSEWKNPYTQIGVGTKIARKIDDEIDGILSTGVTHPIHEIYPQRESFIIAIGLGKYSTDSTEKINNIVSDEHEKLEFDLNTQLDKLLKKEGFYQSYI